MIFQMKRLLFFSFLFVGLLWPTLFAQQDTQKLLEARVDTLLALNAKESYAEAIPLLENIVTHKRAAADWPSAQANAIKLVKALTSLKEYERVRDVLQRGIADLDSVGKGKTVLNAQLWMWQALNNKRLEYYGEAIDAYKMAIGIYEKNKFNGPDLAFCYKNAAQIFIRRDNFLQADKFLEAALRSDSSGTHQLSICGSLANNAYWQDSINRALSFFRLGQTMPQKDLPASASLKATGALILIKINNQQTEEARNLTISALKFYQSRPEQAEHRIRCFTTLARIAALQKNPRQAESYFQKAEAEGKKLYAGKNREMALLYNETGKFYEDNRQLDRALGYYQQALVQALPQFNSLNINDNPGLEEAHLESQAMDAASAKAKVLLKMKPTPRLNAAHCFDFSFAVATRLRRTYGNDADKFALAANNRDNYTAAALNLWQLWHETAADPAILARLFAFLEQTKAQALGDALQQQRALALTGIPDSLLDREKNLRLEAAIAAKGLKETELSGDSVNEVRLKDHAFRQEKAYADFLSALENQYPQFRQYTQAGVAANLTAIQSALPDSAALLSWFDAGDRYLCVAVRRGGLSGFEILRDSMLNGTLSKFLSTLADKSRQEADPTAYFSNAHFLFQKLLPEAAISGTRSLIIVPDGRLSYLPFEALLTAPHTGNYANAPYLLRSKTVQYAWSATLLTLPATAQAGEKGLLQIAPFAKSARDGLATLPNSLRDAPASINATVLDGAEATTEAFLKSAPRHNALHLSTHADAGGRDVPGIELYDRRLTLPEIYAQRFHASLVSLSACETGKGQFAEGEGVLSLARAFAYAGAQSLVASHWAVNERSTAELFSAFYKNLENGLSKAEALRQAKLQYLASPEVDARKTPFHWAAFTLTGADGRVELGYTDWWKWLFAFGGVLMVVVAFWRLRKRR